MNHHNHITIMLVDDEPLIHVALRKALKHDDTMRVLCSAYDGLEALNYLNEYQPDVILLDIQMPHMNGIECLQLIHQSFPHIVIILLTTFEEEQYIIQGLAYNARSYLLKTTTFDDLATHIRSAISGTFVMPERIAMKLARFLHQKKDVVKKSLHPAFFETHGLTRTEQQIVQLLGQRFSYAEIADELAIQIGTLRNHLVTIFEKLNVHSRKEAITLIESYYL